MNLNVIHTTKVVTLYPSPNKQCSTNTLHFEWPDFMMALDEENRCNARYIGKYCNGGAATMGRCLNCFIMGILESGNLELADGTRFERSGCGFTSCRASLGSSETAFLQASRLRWKIACLAYPTPENCRVMGFHCLYETKGTRAGSRNAQENSLRSRQALQQVQLRIHSEFLRNLKCGELTFCLRFNKEIILQPKFIALNIITA